MKVVIAFCHSCRVEIRLKALKALYGSDKPRKLFRHVCVGAVRCGANECSENLELFVYLALLSRSNLLHVM